MAAATSKTVSEPIVGFSGISGASSRCYSFGRNWKRFLDDDYSDQRLSEAIASLTKLFGADLIKGKTFLDIGCGSGLFSLAAWKLGASTVISLDVDPDSVECCRRLAQNANESP